MSFYSNSTTQHPRAHNKQVLGNRSHVGLITDIASNDYSNYDILDCDGYRSLNDGYGGLLVKNNSSTNPVATDSAGNDFDRLTPPKRITIGHFGGYPGSSTDSSAALAQLWTFLRANGGKYSWHMDGDYEIDLGNVTPEIDDDTNGAHIYYVCDFDLVITNRGGAWLRVQNAEALDITGSTSTIIRCFQFGVFASYNTRPQINIEEFNLRQSDDANNTDGCNYGILFSDIFQKNCLMKGIRVDEFDVVNITWFNCQDVEWDVKTEDRRGTVSGHGVKILDATSGNANRANSPGTAGGSITPNTSVSFNTNNRFKLGCQQNEYGIEVQGGVNNMFTGYAQSANANDLFQISSGSGDVTLRDFYLETSNGTHRDLTVESAFSGHLILDNVRTSSIGSRVRINGGTATITGGNLCEGSINVSAPAHIVCDYPPQSGFLNQTGGIILTTRKMIRTVSGTTHTFDLLDMGALTRATNVNAKTFTVPNDAALDFPIGTVLTVRRVNSSNLTLTTGAGVTINQGASATLIMGIAGDVARLTKVASDEWDLEY